MISQAGNEKKKIRKEARRGELSWVICSKAGGGEGQGRRGGWFCSLYKEKSIPEIASRFNKNHAPLIPSHLASTPWIYHYRQITLEWPILHSRGTKTAGRSLFSLFPVMLCKYCCNPLILSLAVCFTSFATEKHFTKSPQLVCFAACVVFHRFEFRHLSTGWMKFPRLINAGRGVPL